MEEYFYKMVKKFYLKLIANLSKKIKHVHHSSLYHGNTRIINKPFLVDTMRREKEKKEIYEHWWEINFFRSLFLCLGRQRNV